MAYPSKTHTASIAYDAPSPKESAFTRLSRAVEVLEDATRNFADLAEQLVGPRQAAEASAGLNPVRSGVIGDVDDKADRIFDLAERISSNVHRINSQL